MILIYSVPCSNQFGFWDVFGLWPRKECRIPECKYVQELLEMNMPVKTMVSWTSQRHLSMSTLLMFEVSDTDYQLQHHQMDLH